MVVAQWGEEWGPGEERTAWKYCPRLIRPELESGVSLTHLSDPFVVVVLSISFIASIFFLHIAAKIVRAFTK